MENEPRVHKAPHHFYFDYTDAPKTIEDIIDRINTKKYDNLDDLLKSIEWELVGDDLIEPINVRHFTKCIVDNEVRLDVMRFLNKYAKQYFRQAAETFEYNENVRVATSTALVRESIKSADEYLDLFVDELGFLIDQLENSGEFSGDKFAKQTKRITELEKQVKELQTANHKLQDKVNRFENPAKYGHYIPSELNNRIFREVMNFLQHKQIVLPLYDDSDYGRRVYCYRWYGKKALFGYYVERMNHELELNEARDLLNWQIFEAAIDNYSDIVDEARKAVSKYRKDPKTLLPAKADIIEDAIRYANGEMKNAEIQKL